MQHEYDILFKVLLTSKYKKNINKTKNFYSNMYCWTVDESLRTLFNHSLTTK